MTDISILSLVICLLPILGVVVISQRWSGSGGELIYATIRMLVQLLLVGYVLVFVFNAPSPWVSVGVVMIMIFASSVIAIRTVKTERLGAFIKSSLAIGIAGTLVLIFILYGVLGLKDPYYQPRVIIPLAGMIYANAMTAITLAEERFARETESGMGYKDARSAAWTAALIPQINSLLAVGLVSIPGMMTGQILSGVDPLFAVRYQIVVMAMILQASGYATAMYLWFARPGADISTLAK